MSNVQVRTAEHPLRRLLVPAAALSLGAALVLGASATYAQDAEGAPADGIDGTWTIDTTIGDFEDFSSSWVGFRVAEVLNPGGEVDAVGRTPAVSGELVATGSIIENAVVEADLTSIVSDRSRRDDAIQRALGTGDFPMATFASSGPVDLGVAPADNEPFSASVPGTLTIRDVSQDVTLELEGQRVGEVVLVVGTLPVDFTSFGVTMPTAPIVVSVQDEGDLEWQLFFARGEAMADEEMADEEMADEGSGDTDMSDEDMAEEEPTEG